MQKSSWMLALSCVGLLACTTTTQPNQAAQSSVAQVKAAPAEVNIVKAYSKDTDKNAVICRKEKVLGSNRSVKVCKTVAQQDDERKQAERMVNDRSLQQSLGGGGGR